MAYRIEPDEGVRDGILRCAVEQLDRAVSELSERLGEDPVKAVHNARKAVKKERSLLRLARGSMSTRRRLRENAALRDAARGLSQARDAEAMIDTLDQLAERYVGQVPESTFHGIRRQLETRRDRQRDELVGSALGAGRRRARGGQGARQALGAERRWLAGDRGWAAAVLHRRAPRLFARPVPALLGEPAHLAQAGQGSLVPAAPAGAELQTLAFCIGSRVYGERPAAFVSRMRRSWKAGHAQVLAARAARPAELANASRAPHPS